MTETWPTSSDELRKEYGSTVAEFGKLRAIREMARRHRIDNQKARRRLIAAGLHVARPKPQAPSPDELRAAYEAACSERGERTAIGALALRYEVDYVSVRRWLMAADLWSAESRPTPIRPITTPCPCGAVATTRYKGQDPPLCGNCYQRAYVAENGLVRSGRLTAVAYKVGKPCVDCGGIFHQAAMDYDHVPERGPKLFNLGQSDRSMAAVIAEIAKCDIVCANCHRIRTWNRNHPQADESAS